MTILDLILGRSRVRVKETERAIVLRKGQVHSILTVHRPCFGTVLV